MKLSIVIPVYYNEDNLEPLYADLKEKVLTKIDYEYELVMVNDGSQDGSYAKMKELAARDSNIKIGSLARNFGAHAAELCGLSRCTGDCVVVKAADLQEPSEMILEMVESWRRGNNVVLAVRKDREESLSQKFFAAMYYWMVRKFALSTMPKSGFDVYLIDRKVVNVLLALDEKNSALTGQILWSGFRTDKVYYIRREREIGKSRWTLKKKFRLVTDTLFGFSTVPITFVTVLGALSFVIALIWAITVLIDKLQGGIPVTGWTTLFIFSLMSFGIIMVTLGILGGYLWRIFDASRNRPVYIVEEENQIENLKEKQEEKQEE